MIQALIGLKILLSHGPRGSLDHKILSEISTLYLSFCLGTKVPKRSAGINRPTDRPWMKLKVHRCACVYVKRHHISHAQHPQLIHTLPGARAGHLILRTPSTARTN